MTEESRSTSVGDGHPRDPEGRGLSDETYVELKRIAENRLREAPRFTSLQATMLVHEAYDRLGYQESPWTSRSHFFATASRAMWNIIVDHARRRLAEKRGGGRASTAIDIAGLFTEVLPVDVLELDELLRKLAAYDSMQHELVLLKCFAGVSMEGIATSLGISKWKAEEEWRHARAWLKNELSKEDS